MDDSQLEKATYKGEQGKYRRLKGKTVFIRSKDKKVTKGPKKGKRLLMKGSPVMDPKKKKKCGCEDHGPVMKSIHENLDTLIKYMEGLNSSKDIGMDN